MQLKKMDAAIVRILKKHRSVFADAWSDLDNVTKSTYRDLALWGMNAAQRIQSEEPLHGTYAWDGHGAHQRAIKDTVKSLKKEMRDA